MDIRPAKSLSPAQMLRILERALCPVEVEHTEVPLPIEGSLPPGLDGVLFRNGPGRFERGGRRYEHFFDGDGHVVRISLGPGVARYTNRFVRTAEYCAEEAAGCMRYRAFGTNLPGGPLANLMRAHFKNAANTNVAWHAGRLLALWEGGPPHRIDPRTLTTLGIEDFGGRLGNRFIPRFARRLAPWLPFAAHPRLDAETGELIGFGMLFGWPHRLLIYRVGADGRMAEPQVHALPRFSFVHDFAVTRRWLCFLLPYADFDMPTVFLGLTTPVGSLRIETHRPMQALLIPRDAPSGSREAQTPRLVDAEPGFIFHIAQGFDGDDGTVVLDAIRMRGHPPFDDLAGLFADPQPDSVPRWERLTIDPERGRCSVKAWTERPSELPTAAPGAFGERRRVLYSLGASPECAAPYFTALHRLDTETGELRILDLSPDLPGEPVVAVADGEHWLLSLVYRSAEHRSDLLVLRASDLEVRAALRLPHAVPIGFHGCWVERSQLG